jgi:hypothetical protein
MVPWRRERGTTLTMPRVMLCLCRPSGDSNSNIRTQRVEGAEPGCTSIQLTIFAALLDLTNPHDQCARAAGTRRVGHHRHYDGG